MKFSLQTPIDWWNIMKITFSQLLIAFILCGVGYANTGNAQAVLTRKVDITVSKQTLSSVLKKISKETKVKFVYSNNIVQSSRMVSIEAEGASLKTVLDQLLTSNGISYEVINERIVLSKSASATSLPVELSENESEVARFTVTGIVTDEKGESLPGVTVLIKGTKTAVTTDVKGAFSINVPTDNEILVFSYIGFNSQEIPVNGSRNINVILKAQLTSLDEVIVLGYGTQKRRDVTGSTSTVKAEDIMQNPVMSLEQALQGRAPGVRVMQSNGAPGGAVQVQIRGVGSTNTNNNGQPLYVLDGIPLFDAGGENTASAGSSGSPQKNVGSPIANINPNDIESMEILKDASATAIYGSRAANGVVLITTKRGKAGKTAINLDYYNGVQVIQKKLPLLVADEGMVAMNRAILNTVDLNNRFIDSESFNPFAFSSSPTFKNTDWQNEMFRPAGIQEANLLTSGGIDKLRFAISGNYFKQDGIVINTGMKRLSTRINLDVNANSKLKFSSSTALSYQDGNNIYMDNPFQGNLTNAIGSRGSNAAYNADGSYFGPLSESTFWNVNQRNSVFEAKEFTQNVNRKRALTNFFGEYEIIKGLKFKSSYGLDFTLLDQRRRTPAIPRGPLGIFAGPNITNNGTQRVQRATRQGINWVAEQTLGYTRTIHTKHQFDGLIGFSAQSFKSQGVNASGDGSTNPLLNVISINTNSNVGGGESFNETGLVSQFARLHYSFASKYLLTSTIRRDGSSIFGPKNKYGIFPSIGLGWRVSEEGFFKKIVPEAVSNMKIRASYGITGSQDIGPFAYLARIFPSNAFFAPGTAEGAGPVNFANEDIRWEELEQTDIALELGLFKGRIDLTAEYYVKNSNDLLYGTALPITSGFGGIAGNLGDIQNKGFEFSINTVNTTGAFKWSTNFNISTLKNKVLKLGDVLGGGTTDLPGYSIFLFPGSVNITRVGYPIASFYGLVNDGIFQTAEEAKNHPRFNNTIPQPGDLKVRDVNGDGVITVNGDRVFLGSPFPKYFGGLSNDFSYKNFSLSVLANFSVGNKIFNQQKLLIERGGTYGGSVAVLDAWTGAGTSDSRPRVTVESSLQGVANRIAADRYLEDGSFLRIRNVTLGYTIPSKFVNKYKIQNLRLYGSVSNLFTFTKYSGWDPEINSSGSDVLATGIDQTGYPVARTFQLGLNLGF